MMMVKNLPSLTAATDKEMLKEKFLLFVIACSKITSGVVNGSEFLSLPQLVLNLTNYAVQSRQHISGQNFLPPYNYLNEHSPSSFYPPEKQSSVLQVLATIAQNDVLRCVPRLVCEVTAMNISPSDSPSFMKNLPLNIDVSAILRLLSIVDLGNSSPISFFGKAAALGYVSKGDTNNCLDAYPQCPRDSNKLVFYLNNYNGGFFRLFNGIRRPYPVEKFQVYQNPQYYRKNQNAERRILNKHITSFATQDSFNTNDDFFNHIAHFNSIRNGAKTLTFPSSDSGDPFAFRKPKELPFSLSYYHSNDLDLQKPLSNHVANPIIYPDRTGTGDLRLDAEELSEGYHQYFSDLETVGHNPLYTPYVQNNIVNFPR